MSKVTLDDRSGPWTEDEFLALDETNYRIELVDGSLLVSPGPNGPHQDISGRLHARFLPVADAAGLRVRHDMNVRLAAGTIVRPDLIIERGPRVTTVTDASDVILACEITSPSNATTDHVLKKNLYAAANIRWYLLIEPDMTDYESLTLRLFRLEAGQYVAYAVAENGQALTMDEPFSISINGRSLLGL